MSFSKAATSITRAIATKSAGFPLARPLSLSATTAAPTLTAPRRRCFASHTGSCHCGTVKFQADTDPVAVVNCHCSVCRRCHSASYAPLVVFEPWKLRVTQGANRLTKYTTGKEDRFSCSCCGSKVYSELNHLKKRAAFLQNFDGHGADGKIRVSFKPTFHIFYGSGTIDVKDGLPKYDTLPAALGGSDKQLPENFHSKR